MQLTLMPCTLSSMAILVVYSRSWLVTTSNSCARAGLLLSTSEGRYGIWNWPAATKHKTITNCAQTRVSGSQGATENLSAIDICIFTQRNREEFDWLRSSLDTQVWRPLTKVQGRLRGLCIEVGMHNLRQLGGKHVHVRAQRLAHGPSQGILPVLDGGRPQWLAVLEDRM